MLLENVEIGDKVVIAPTYQRDLYKVGTIEKITPTQVTIDGTRFNRRDGYRIGDGNSWHRVRIAQNWFSDNGNRLMTVEEADKRNAEITEENNRIKLIGILQNIRRSDMENIEVSILQQVVDMLGLK